MDQGSIHTVLPTGTYVAPAARRRLDVLSAWLTLAKPRIAVLVVFTAVVACVAAADGTPPTGTLLLLIVSGMLAAGGAATINQVVDRSSPGRSGGQGWSRWWG
jgi:protoheme IX farnesyltransferase